jgi:hypothetical protein
MWLIQRQHMQAKGVDTLFKIEEDIDRAYEAESQGLLCFEIQDKEDATEKLKSYYDQGLEPGYTHIQNRFGHSVLSEPIYDPINSSDLVEEVLKKGSVLTCNYSINSDLGEGFVVTDFGSMSKVEYNPSKARAKRKAPEYRQTTKFRYGRVPLYWFRKYANIVHRYLDLPVYWSYGWGTWDGVEYSYRRVHPRVKRLILTELRRKTDWYNMVEEASYYVHGAELHQKDNFRSSWAESMRQECEVLGIEIPNYQKKKKKGGKSA